MAHQKFNIECDEHEVYKDKNCLKCLAEMLSQHIDFRNGDIVIKKARLED